MSVGMGLVIFAGRLMDGASAEALCLIVNVGMKGLCFPMEMNTKLKYLPIAAFAAIALTLAGCGGGGGGGDDAPVTSSTGAPSAEMVEAAAAAVMAAETAKTALSDAWAAYEVAPSEAGATAITDAAAALVAAAAVLGEAAVDDDQTEAAEGFNAYAALVGAVLDNAGRAVASVEMAAAERVTELNSQISGLNDQIDDLMMRPTQESVDTQVETLQGQINDLMMRPTQESVDTQVETLQGQIDDLMMQADVTLEQVTALNDQITTLTGERDKALEDLAEVREMAADALAAAAKADRIARADMVIMAIGVTPGTAQAGPTTTTSDVATPVIKRNVAGMMTVDVNGDDDDAYAGGETTASSGDWNSFFMLTKTNDEGEDTESTDTVVIYTDIDGPADKKFNDQYVLDDRANILNHEDRVKLAVSNNFPSGASDTLMYSADSGQPLSFAGAFDGVPGTYECETADGCTLSTDAKGALVMAEGWRFTPNDNLATIKDPDAAYAWFGWWLDKPKDNDTLHTVEVFAGGTDGHAAEIGMAIEGTATYRGTAAGKYATRTFTAGVQTDAAVGHFTANASLTARFGDDDEPGSGINGSISGFMLDDTTPAAWSVTLEKADFMTGLATFTGFTEVNFGGGATDTDAGETNPGAWQGSFYGDATEDSDAPDAVAGTFSAAVANASVVGGFGATKQ